MIIEVERQEDRVTQSALFDRFQIERRFIVIIGKSDEQLLIVAIAVLVSKVIAVMPLRRSHTAVKWHVICSIMGLKKLHLPAICQKWKCISTVLKAYLS